MARRPWLRRSTGESSPRGSPSGPGIAWRSCCKDLGPTALLLLSTGYASCVPLPCSRSYVDRLGVRLRDAGYLDNDDALMFNLVLRYYLELLDLAAARLRQLGLEVSTRVKTTGTLTEKLQRDRKIQLSRVHDVAGARVIAGTSRLEQDATVEAIRKEFDDGVERSPLVVDRRVNPSHGYRAVHVVVFIDKLPVEIQVRTVMQDAWAQIYEALADRWGR